MRFLNNPFSIWFWLTWAIFLVWQNYAFTYVSRARNSASLKSHCLAALQSNGVWFLQTLFVFGAFKSILDGKFGYGMTAAAVLYYTAFTMVGSIWAHYRRLKKEAGANAVGANKKYAQVPVEEWARVQEMMVALNEGYVKSSEFERVAKLAQDAYGITVGLIPDSGISASKVGGAAMVSGLPSDADPMDFIKKK